MLQFQFIGNSMHWISQTCSPTEGNFKGASSQGFGGRLTTKIENEF